MQTNKRIMFLLLSMAFAIGINAQNYQTVRGMVKEENGNTPIPFATITLIGNQGTIGCTADSLGQFVVKHVAAGRYDIKVSYLGYEPFVMKEVLVGSGRELQFDIKMRESSNTLGEVVVRPRINKQEPLNLMSLSGRMLSVEEAGRYAGAMDDPARLVSSFAGVSQNVGNNGIAVRGNAPKFLQWRMQGVEIPNPNHFADVTSFGGGGLTALSTQVLGNSDFYTGAFPAEYSNALSGVFDMYFRKGNNQNYEHALQVGTLGVEVASEGPFKKGYAGSYLFNYRYSTLSLLSPLLPDDADGTDYQDLSFNISLPTRKMGYFSIWGIGLIDRSGTTPEKDHAKWEYEQDRQDQDVKQYMGAAGITHKVYLGETAFVESSLATTVNGINMHTELMDEQDVLQPKNIVKNTSVNYVASSYLQNRFSHIHTNRTGFRWTGMEYHLHLNEHSEDIANTSGFSSLLNLYTESMLDLGKKVKMNVGVTSQYFLLNKHYTIEPRLSAKWQMSPLHSLTFAYGLNSRLEMLNYYFTQDEQGKEVNKDLDFTKAHHFSLAYDWSMNENTHLRIEPYFQWLYDVPVIGGNSTFSMINLQGNDDWFISDRLVNDGYARNYGVDLTLEQYMKHGFFYTATASVYDSKYRTSKGGEWYNSRYNRHFTFNLLGGKEWMVGKSHQNILCVSGKLAYQGGDRYSPIDEASSLSQKDAIYDETHPYTCQLSPMFLAHITLSYRINRKHVSHEIAAKLINVTGYKDYYGHRYNFLKNQVEAEREANVVPNISYKIYFSKGK